MAYPLFLIFMPGWPGQHWGLRVAPVFFILPFLNNGVLSGVVRTAVIMLVVLGMTPFRACRAGSRDEHFGVAASSPGSVHRDLAGMSVVMAILGVPCHRMYF